MSTGAIPAFWTTKPKSHLTVLAILVVVSLIPIPMGGAPVSGNDIIIPGLFAITLIDIAVRSKTLDYFLPGRGNIQAVFVTLFFFTILLSFARKPALPTSLMGADSDMAGLKLYWKYFCCFLAYLIAIYWINRNRIAPSQVLSIYLPVAFFMSFLGFLMIATGIKIPGLSGHAWHVSQTSVGATRLPFLGAFAQLGFILVLTEGSGKLKYRWAYLGFFALGIFLSGGRAVLFATLAALIVWFLLNRRFLLTGVGLGSVLLIAITAQIVQEIAPNPQLQQLAKVGGSLEEDSVQRSFVFQGLISEIKENPIFGTGFGKSYDTGLIIIRGKFVDADFVDKQLRSGSHSTHLQLMKNLGLVGYLPYMLIWLYSIYKLLPVAFNPPPGMPNELQRNARFCILITVALLIRWGFEGNGSGSSAYVYAALFSVVISHVLYYQSARHSKRAVPVMTAEAN